MPANLTPEYRRAQELYRAASEPKEQLEALREMLRVIPKHKGTEHLQADIKRRIKEAKAEVQSVRKRKKRPSFVIDSGEYPQVAVLGPPNAGKSAIITALSGVELAVAPYPYSTREPHPAMMRFENTRVQLVDTPPILEDSMAAWLPDLARGADAVLLVVDLAAGDVLEACEAVLGQLSGHKLFLGEVPSSHREAAGVVGKPALMVANKSDAEDAEVALEILRELYGQRYEILATSTVTGEGLELLRRRIWERLDLVRAIPKPPGKPADREDPILLPRGSTLVDMARTIHGEIAAGLKRARIWGSPHHKEGTWVSREHVVEDGEIFELET